MRLYTKSLYYSIAGITIVAMLAAVADAQTDQGRVRGSVRDSSNAFVPGVTVMATNERTGDIRPGQPYTKAAAGTFGTLTSTVVKTVGMGTNRQVQFALRLNF